MDAASIDRMLESLDSPKIAKFGSNPLSSTLIPGFGYLFMCMRTKTLMIYTRIDRLGAECKAFPELFEMLLTSDVSAGRFNNLRLAYDSDTTVLWICYDIKLDELTTIVLRDGINDFINNAKSFKKLMKTQLLDVIMQTLRSSQGLTDESVQLSPDMEQSCALSLSVSNITAEKNYEQNKPLSTQPNIQAQLKQNMVSAAGAQGIGGGPGEAGNPQEPELVDVMIAQSMFMLA
ncbi:hypothetical protein SAMN02910357_00772 [Succinivibrio dextrinosolvens]|uniref:type III secretion system chaperone n=1 Tax=Succinivibrio dextrinosolvens TaxID=83771 RepID=UPI0008F0FD4C|nr:type III secretion system chaperone [Succinivibrio dextrinosolvens]SFS44480.1 hypothetical protein SAMN02910357_00772 [Succinivibrio dextrinosolvens]